MDMAIDPSNANNLLVGIQGLSGEGGIWRTNALASTPTFTNTLPLGTTTNFVRAKLAINKVGSTVTVLAGTGQASGVSSCNNAYEAGVVRKSTDGGATWPTVESAFNGFCGSHCNYSIAIAMDPNNSNNVYTGGSQDGVCSAVFKRSTDGGLTATISESGLHRYTSAIALAPSSPSTVYLASDGGIFSSANSGTNWSSLNNSTLNAMLHFGLAVHPTDAHFTLTGLQLDGTALLRPDMTWTRVDKNEGLFPVIDQNATDTTNVTMYHSYGAAQNHQIAFGRATNGVNATDASWTVLGCVNATSANGISCGDAVFLAPPLALGPGNPNTLYVGTDRLYRSTNQGTNNSVVSQAPLFTGKAITAIGISPQTDMVRIVGLNNGKVFATTTGSSVLTDVTSSSFPPSDYPPDPTRGINAAVIDPNNSNTAYIGMTGYGVPAGQHIWKTTSLSGGAGTGSPPEAASRIRQ